MTTETNKKLNNEIWKVIKDTLLKYDNIKLPDKVKELIEQKTEIKEFNGGVFLSIGNEFDIFVVPERQGKWNIRGEVTKYLNEMTEKYGTLIVKIHQDNSRSLRLAKFFGFVEIANNNGEITLERRL
jgi:predicted PolB exonuclease-like 3'-5' exonuclease